MFLVATRNFPPELGGMQNLMEGLSNALLNHGPVKVFADSINNAEDYDQNSKLSIERVSGFKIFRKYRKSNLVKDFIQNNNLRASFFDHWKSIENIDEEVLKKTKSFCLIHSKEINHPVGSSLNKRTVKDLKPVINGDSDLKIALKMIAQTQKGHDEQIPSMGCNIKWLK